MPAVPGGRPARPAGQPGPCRRPPPVTSYPALPVFPSGRAGPPASPGLAALPVACAHGSAGSLAQAGCPGRVIRAAGRARAGAGLDGAGGAERGSWRTHGQAAAGNAHRSRPALRRPGRRTRHPGRPAADDRGGDRRAAGVPGRVLPLAPAGNRPGGRAAARRRVRVRRSALTAWLRRREEDTPEEQETGDDGQLRRQVLGHQEDRRQRLRGAVPGPVGGRRPRALQVVQGPPAGRRVPHRA